MIGKRGDFLFQRVMLLGQVIKPAGVIADALAVNLNLDVAVAPLIGEDIGLQFRRVENGLVFGDFASSFR